VLYLIFDLSFEARRGSIAPYEVVLEVVTGATTVVAVAEVVEEVVGRVSGGDRILLQLTTAPAAPLILMLFLLLLLPLLLRPIALLLPLLLLLLTNERQEAAAGTGVRAGFKNFIALDCIVPLAVRSTASSSTVTIDPANFLDVTECAVLSLMISSSLF
jgi:hypothetical protein